MAAAKVKRIFDPFSLGLALVLAILVWAYVDDRRMEIQEFEVPLVVQVPEGWELEENPPRSLTVRLQGPREQMKTLRPNDLTIRKEMPLPEADKDTKTYESKINDNDIPTPPGVNVVSKSLENLNVNYLRLIPKYIRVKPVLVGQPAEGYRVLTATAEPRIVKVMAPKDVLNFGDTLETYPVDINGKSQSMGLTVGVKPSMISGRKIRSDTDVWVSVIIEPIPQQRTIEKVPVRILYGPILNLRIIKITPATVNIEVEGTQSVVSKLTERDLVIYADMVDITGTAEGEHTLSLRALPHPDMVVKSITPAEVTITVK